MIFTTAPIDKLSTERLVLIPYTKEICANILNNNYSDLATLQLIKGKSWPDEEVLDTLPRIINNLEKVPHPTGFESWMIIKKDTSEIIGDVGFKGFNHEEGTIDLGYGIIQEERGKGYATEAVHQLIKWAFTNPIVKQITAACLPDNTQSIKLLNKFKFQQMNIENGMIYWKLLKLNAAI